MVYIDSSTLRRPTTGSTPVTTGSEPVTMATTASCLARAFGKSLLNVFFFLYETVNGCVILNNIQL